MFIPGVCGLPGIFRRTLLTYLGSVWSDSLLRRGFQAHVPRVPTQETCRGELFPFGVVYIVVSGRRLLLFWDVVCSCFGTSFVVVLGRFGVGAEPRAPTQETCRGQTVFPSFPVFFECRLSLFWGLGCHSLGVLSVVVLGSCLLFWGGICCCCF